MGAAKKSNDVPFSNSFQIYFKYVPVDSLLSFAHFDVNFKLFVCSSDLLRIFP